MTIARPIRIGILEDNSFKCAALKHVLSIVLSKNDSLEVFDSLGPLRLKVNEHTEPFDILISDLNLPDSGATQTAMFLEKEVSRLAKLILVNSSDLQTTEMLVNSDSMRFVSLGTLQAQMGLDVALARQVEAARLLA